MVVVVHHGMRSIARNNHRLLSHRLADLLKGRGQCCRKMPEYSMFSLSKRGRQRESCRKVAIYTRPLSLKWKQSRGKFGETKFEVSSSLKFCGCILSFQLWGLGGRNLGWAEVIWVAGGCATSLPDLTFQTNLFLPKPIKIDFNPDFLSIMNSISGTIDQMTYTFQMF